MVYIFLSLEPFIQGTLNYVQRPTTIITTIMASKNGNLRQIEKQEHADTKTYQKRRKIKIQNKRKSQKTYLFAEEGDES